MANKKKELTQEQVQILRSRGMRPEYYTVLIDCPQSLLVRNIITLEARMIYKQDPWARVKH